MYQRALPLALVHVTFTLLYVVAGLVTQQHSVWSLLSALGFSHVCTGFIVCIYVGQRDDDMTNDRILAARPYIILLLVTSVFAMVLAGLVVTIVVTCHPSFTLAPLIVDESYASDIRDERRYKRPTVALFLSLVSVIFAGHLVSVIWTSVLVHRTNTYLQAARL